MRLGGEVDLDAVGHGQQPLIAGVADVVVERDPEALIAQGRDAREQRLVDVDVLEHLDDHALWWQGQHERLAQQRIGQVHVRAHAGREPIETDVAERAEHHARRGEGAVDRPGAHGVRRAAIEQLEGDDVATRIEDRLACDADGGRRRGGGRCVLWGGLGHGWQCRVGPTPRL